MPKKICANCRHEKMVHTPHGEGSSAHPRRYRECSIPGCQCALFIELVTEKVA